MVAATASVVRTLFIVLFCVIVAAFLYVFIFGDFIECFDLNSRWQTQIVGDITVFALTAGAWVAYKESSWIIAAVVVFSIYIAGSIATIGYILIQFYKLPHEANLRDPLYVILARQNKRGGTGGETSIVSTSAIFSVLGFLMLEVLVYTIIIEISPSYTKYFTSCTLTAVIDIYIQVIIFSVWIMYKESSWTSSFFWIALLVCFRGFTLCAYIVRELFYLSPKEPASLIIFNRREWAHTTDRERSSA